MAQDPDLVLASYDYELPRELIAQQPIEPRDAARLLVLDRATGVIEHRGVSDLPMLLRAGDLVVVNRSRVLRARLSAVKVPSGGQVEITLVRPLEGDDWEALIRAHRLAPNQRVRFANSAEARIGEPTAGGRRVSFPGVDVGGLLDEIGEAPLPPYIHDYSGDPDRYQTVYADELGSAAAPTAGFHFTPQLIGALQARGVEWTTVLLHIGLDTFKPVVEQDVRNHQIHTEWVEVSSETVAAVEATRARGCRVVAVGTSSVRALEYAARDRRLKPYRGPVDLFIVPGYEFRVVDVLMTNFHMPRTTVLLLVSAFAGRDRVLAAYEEAKEERYRFLSFGDAMLIH